MPFTFFGSLDLSSLSCKTGFFLGIFALRCLSRLLLFGFLGFSGFDLFFKRAQRSFSFLSLLLKLTFLTCFLVPVTLSA